MNLTPINHISLRGFGMGGALIATIRVGNNVDDNTFTIKYIVGDHLNNSTAVLKTTGSHINSTCITMKPEGSCTKSMTSKATI